MSKNIKSYVMFDTETTGLPSPGNNPRITELSLMAVSREELMTRQRDQRVLNKLHLCVNPCKQIHPKSSELTGLHNDSLSLQATFRKQADLIVAFLKNLPQPTCLLAHNGHRFDFPLLKAELKRSKTTLSDNVHCADTLEAFRVFDGLPPAQEFVLEKELQKKKQQDIKGVEANKLCASSGSFGSQEIKNSEKMGVDGKSPEMNLGGKKRSFDCQVKCDEGNVKEMRLELLNKPIHQQNHNELTPERKTSTSGSLYHLRHPIIGEGSYEDDRPRSVNDSDNVRKRLFKSPKLSLKSNNNKDAQDVESMNNDIVQDNCGSISHDYSVSRDDVDDNSADDSNSTQCYFNPDSTTRNSTESSQNLRHNSISDSDKDFLAACSEVDSLLSPSLPVGNSDLRPNIDSKIIVRSELKDTVDSDAKSHCTGNSTMAQVEKDNEIGNKCSIFNCSQQNVIKRSSVIVQNSSNVSTQPSPESKTANFDMKQSQDVSSKKAATVTVHPQSPCVRKSYALGNLYKFYFGQTPDVAHTAEDDCKTLLKLISLNVDKLISYCDQNAVLFSDIEPMY